MNMYQENRLENQKNSFCIQKIKIKENFHLHKIKIFIQEGKFPMKHSNHNEENHNQVKNGKQKKQWKGYIDISTQRIKVA